MKMFICGHCGKENYPKPCNTLYRTCDAYVCNAICQQERVIAITKLDPMMINPILWRLDSWLVHKEDATPIKRKNSMIGLQDLENNKKLSISTLKLDKHEKSFDFNDTLKYKNNLNTPPNNSYEYIMLTLVIAGTTLLLLKL
ncbi:MAG: hypothetical protein CBC22_04945 [Alphaproteobacteria bacterium TMED62]|nr:MAG: hypothetical protein CBC22_04945 [Alphaproteobacteria bacterium TMED62]|tara:strand:- start:1217 stop:1642 length:426 start_codon:yes stop_codon:yes gene_type:complete